MATNGNPVGSKKVIAAQTRMNRERQTLSNVQVFTVDSEQASKVLGVKVESGMVPVDLDVVVDVINRKGQADLFRFLLNGAEVSINFVRTSCDVITECQKVLKRFGA